MNAPSSTETTSDTTVPCPFCGCINAIRPQTLERLKVRCVRCKLLLSNRRQAYFKHLDPAVYMHPEDAEALKALKNLPGIHNLLSKMQVLSEQTFGEAFFAANGLRIGSKQYPDLHAKLTAACQIMGIQQLPNLYLSHVDLFGEMGMYSHSGGSEQPFIVLSPRVLDHFDEMDVLAVLAGELGHIHCGHMRYKVFADYLCLVTHKVFKKTPLENIADNISLPVQQALVNWRVKANLSADRTAMLVLQNEKAIFGYLLKQAGGTINSRANLEAFVAQAHQLNGSVVNNWLDKYWQQFLHSQRIFSFPVWRAAELLQWSRENQKGYGYQDIVKIFAT